MATFEKRIIVTCSSAEEYDDIVNKATDKLLPSQNMETDSEGRTITITQEGQIG